MFKGWITYCNNSTLGTRNNLKKRLIFSQTCTLFWNCIKSPVFMHYILFKRPTFILLGNILSEICPNFVSNFIFLPILYLSLFLTQLLSNFLNNHTISYEIISLSFIAKLLFLCTSRSSFQFHVSIFVLFQIILYYFILDYFIIL